jgi:hypothetical protein
MHLSSNGMKAIPPHLECYILTTNSIWGWICAHGLLAHSSGQMHTFSQSDSPGRWKSCIQRLEDSAQMTRAGHHSSSPSAPSLRPTCRTGLSLLCRLVWKPHLANHMVLIREGNPQWSWPLRQQQKQQHVCFSIYSCSYSKKMDYSTCTHTCAHLGLLPELAA